EPGANAEIPAGSQPLTLLVENAGTNGQRPIWLAVQIATDAQFKTIVFERGKVALGQNGSTTLRLPDSLASDRTYYWRSRALDGANTGPWSEPVKFTIFTPAIIEAPVPVSPTDGQTVSSN